MCLFQYKIFILRIFLFIIMENKKNIHKRVILPWIQKHLSEHSRYSINIYWVKLIILENCCKNFPFSFIAYDYFLKVLETIKNTHLIFNYITSLSLGLKVKLQLLSCVWLFATPWTVAHHAPVPGIPQARILEWVAIPFSRRSSQSRDQTQVSRISGRFFTIWATTEASFLVYF